MNSHILPEFLHKSVYDEKHRTILCAFTEIRPVFLQKGLREKLLCHDCEERLQVYENYFAQYWYLKPPLPDRVDCSDIFLNDIDYSKFKLFLLSIVWRASVSTLPTFSSVRLGPHEERIRLMILNADPSSHENYPVLGGAIIDSDTGRLWDQGVLHPIRLRVGSHWACRMVFGGVAFTVITSSHQTLSCKEHFLTVKGELRLTVITLLQFAKITGIVDLAQSIEKKLPTTS